MSKVKCKYMLDGKERIQIFSYQTDSSAKLFLSNGWVIVEARDGYVIEHKGAFISHVEIEKLYTL